MYWARRFFIVLRQYRFFSWGDHFTFQRFFRYSWLCLSVFITYCICICMLLSMQIQSICQLSSASNCFQFQELGYSPVKRHSGFRHGCFDWPHTFVREWLYTTSFPLVFMLICFSNVVLVVSFVISWLLFLFDISLSYLFKLVVFVYLPRVRLASFVCMFLLFLESLCVYSRIDGIRI